jgi:hypothetical protein
MTEVATTKKREVHLMAAESHTKRLAPPPLLEHDNEAPNVSSYRSI